MAAATPRVHLDDVTVTTTAIDDASSTVAYRVLVAGGETPRQGEGARRRQSRGRDG